MSLKDVKFIATDMDHTLLTEASVLPPRFQERLDALDRLGIQFGIASGRPLYTLQDIFPAYHQKLALISDNGGVISYQGQIISKTLMPTDTVQEMVRVIRDKTDGLPLICGLTEAIGQTKDRQFDSVYREFYHQLSYRDDLTSWTGEADKITIYLPNGDAKAVFNDVIAPRFGAHFSAAISGPVWIDIMMPGINKGNGMRVIGKQMGITTDEMMAFGDNFNDAEMLKAVKYSYLVNNFAPGMEKFATYRTGTNEEYGVVQVLDQVIAAHQAS